MKDALLEPCLFGYWRSSAAYRVRIALNLKRITARQVSVQLQLGEQTSDEHRAQNPDEQVLRCIQITINGISAGLRNSG